MIDSTAYLARIGYTGPHGPTAGVLRSLQRAHLLAVPFENLDIHLGQPIRLDPSLLFNKIVHRRRGGYCFELNGLFALLLEDLGFSVQRLSASSANDDGSYKAPFEHLALSVQARDEPGAAWLVDVGWGDGPIEPLLIEEGTEQDRSGRLYRLRSENEFLILEEKLAAGDWLKHYRFDLLPHDFEEFSDMNQYMQTSPDTIFTQKRLCTLFLPSGRVTVSDQRFILTRNKGLRGSEEKEERSFPSEIEARQALFEWFGMNEDSFMCAGAGDES
jgi:N-hydroxyarylamine O-acetyltransferase